MWSIPLKGMYMDRSGELHKFEILFDKRRAEVELVNFDWEDPSCWLKLNPGLTGFYRVHYGERLFAALLGHLSSKYLTAIDRMSIFDDQVAMVLSEGGSTARLLKVVELYKDFETSGNVWRTVCGVLQQVRTLTWSMDELANSCDQFCLDMLRPVLARVGFMPSPKEPSSDSTLRSVLLPMMAMLKDEEVLRQSVELFRHHLDEIAPVPGSIRDGVFRAAMAGGGQQTLNQMLMLYRQTELAEERVSILSALGMAQEPDMLAQVLEFALSPDVHTQEAMLVICSVASTRVGHRFAWNFFMANIDKIVDRYVGGLFLFSRLVRSVTENFCDRDSLREVSDFFAANRSRLAGAEQAVTQAEEHVNLNVIWHEKDVDQIQAFLDGYFHS